MSIIETFSIRHSWNAIDIRRVPACETIDGNDRTERTCVRCGAVKITVHPPKGLPWREWRSSEVSATTAKMPECAASAEPSEVPFA